MPTLLSLPEPADIAELVVACSRRDMSITNFAVEGLVLNDEGQAVLIKRGPMYRDNIGLLEGIGARQQRRAISRRVASGNRGRSWNSGRN